MEILAGTATCSFAGTQSAQSEYSGLTVVDIAFITSLQISDCLVTITSPGTIILSAIANTSSTALAATSVNSYPNATGMTAVKIA